jgi:hypothetical protein
MKIYALNRIAVLLLITLPGFVMLTGCYTSTTVTKNDTASIDSTADVIKVTTVNGNIFRFDQQKGIMAHMRDSLLIGKLPDGSLKIIPVSDIDKLEIRKLSIPLTLGLSPIMVGLAAAVFIGILISLNGGIHMS